MNRKQKFIKWVASWFGIEIFFEQFTHPVIPTQPIILREQRFHAQRLEARQEFNRHEIMRMRELGIDVRERMAAEVCKHLHAIYKEDFEFIEMEGPRGVECCIRLEIWKEEKR